MKKLSIFIISFCIFALSAFHKKIDNKATMPNEKLSDYHFFKGNGSEQKPAYGVLPYSLNTPLFTDYAEKLRFVKIADNQTVAYNEKEVLDFPVGSTIIKTFYYPNDFRKPELGRRLIETRLLIHENDGWKALDYIWNDEQTEAFLEVAGDTKEVSYIDANGKKKKHAYGIPNINQCKGCHNRNEKMLPIGPSARQLNGSFQSTVNTALSSTTTSQTTDNQLFNWQKLGILTNLPAIENIPKSPIWNKPESGSLDARARTWLDINCAHCHRLGGPAQTSGLNLSIHETEPIALGIMKTPVAAGRGSGNLKYGIVPKKPDESIIIYRMESTDPGVMMPEVGRKTMHKEGIELIKEWIRGMK